MRGLVYADVRHMSHLNTGSDLDLEKVQDAYTVVNARVGLRGPDGSAGSCVSMRVCNLPAPH